VMVRVSAVSVNPADVKIRASLPQSQQPRILGFDGRGLDLRPLAPRASPGTWEYTFTRTTYQTGRGRDHESLMHFGDTDPSS
jgi:hypothetical protein